MSRRGYEGHMDWEYQNEPPQDATSPFTKFGQRQRLASFQSPSPARFETRNTNPFAAAAAANAQSQSARPPHSAFFNPQFQQPKAASFRNPAFNTPQKPFNDVPMSDFSGIESSPAMTDNGDTDADASEFPADTPDVDHVASELAQKTITPSLGRSLFGRSRTLSNRASGRGELARGDRTKVRKRKRQAGDRDVGSVRPRLDHDSDESDSDYPFDASQSRKAKKGSNSKRGWFGGFLSTISNHPNAPAILSDWMNLSVNFVLVLSVLSVLYYFFNMVRTDVAAANEMAKAELLEKIRTCSEKYVQNRCERDSRVPAIEQQCQEWDLCMHQDIGAINYASVTAKSATAILNEFVETLAWKTWLFIIVVILVVALAKSLASVPIRPAAASAPAVAQTVPPTPFPSQPVGAAFMHPYANPNIFMSPYHKNQRHLLDGGGSDTDDSPARMGLIMAPQTPSRRRSPSKGERSRSPSKRSPSKGY